MSNPQQSLKFTKSELYLERRRKGMTPLEALVSCLGRDLEMTPELLRTYLKDLHPEMDLMLGNDIQHAFVRNLLALYQYNINTTIADLADSIWDLESHDSFFFGFSRYYFHSDFSKYKETIRELKAILVKHYDEMWTHTRDAPTASVEFDICYFTVEDLDEALRVIIARGGLSAGHLLHYLKLKYPKSPKLQFPLVTLLSFVDWFNEKLAGGEGGFTEYATRQAVLEDHFRNLWKREVAMGSYTSIKANYIPLRFETLLKLMDAEARGWGELNK